jgi:ATP-dependent helicase/nuclease subunit B
MLRGSAIHKALERFAEDWDAATIDAAPARFEAAYREELLKAGLPEAALAREQTLGAAIARWAVDFEIQRRAGGAHVYQERAGQMAFASPRGDFVLTARADRLEVKDGRISVIDFKTGAAPSWKQVRTGFSPQLSLTAAIARAGGFAGLGSVEPRDLLYVSVTGRDPPARITEVSGPGQREPQAVEQTVDEALEGLNRLIGDYERRERAYVSRSAPPFAQRAYSDYDHLARVREWSVADDAEPEA